MLKLADIYIIFTYVVVADARRLIYIGDCVETMESFGSFMPHRAGKRSVQGLSLIHISGPALKIQGSLEL